MIEPSRRRFLALATSASAVALAGCTRSNVTDWAGTETPTPEETEPGCWPSMCEGTGLVEVVVNSDFSGTVVLETSCRDEPVSLGPGESVQVVREEDGETCGVTLSIDGEQVFGERIEGHVSVTVRVGPDGEIDAERVML